MSGQPGGSPPNPGGTGPGNGGGGSTGPGGAGTSGGTGPKRGNSLILLPLALLLAAGGYRLGRRHVDPAEMEQDRSQGAQPPRRITADIPDEEVDGYRLGTRTGLPHPRPPKE